MLINLSNHPSANWSTNQITAASKYGDIIDIPFLTLTLHSRLMKLL
ncbi:MAG: hypothetical protein IPL23_15555 [Saprospiraceae bacterium]|nr:hypothetical protein [Saprospiraceae bacterium]